MLSKLKGYIQSSPDGAVGDAALPVQRSVFKVAVASVEELRQVDRLGHAVATTELTLSTISELASITGAFGDSCAKNDSTSIFAVV